MDAKFADKNDCANNELCFGCLAFKIVFQSLQILVARSVVMKDFENVLL